MSQDDKRHSKRIGFQAAVLFGLEKPPCHWAYITNISDTGIFIKTNLVFKAGKKLYVTVKDDKGDYEMEGMVMRAKKIPPAFAREGKSGMGVELIRYDEDLLALYREKLEAETA